MSSALKVNIHDGFFAQNWKSEPGEVKILIDIVLLQIKYVWRTLFNEQFKSDFDHNDFDLREPAVLIIPLQAIYHHVTPFAFEDCRGSPYAY